MTFDESTIIEIRRYLDLDARARSKRGISLDEAIERKNLAMKYEEVSLMNRLLDEIERLISDVKG